MLAQVQTVCRNAGLDIVAAFHPTPADLPPEDCKTLILLGPLEPGFWARITASPEYSAPDPVDHWSSRVITSLARDVGATALFPFGGPPYQPFIRWALASGHVWQSPVSLMVHGRAGLMISFRGALAFTQRLALPIQPNPPCPDCTDKPCLTACPTNALSDEGYNLTACHGWLDRDEGKSCLTGGCLVRRACPISQTYGRLNEQSAHHMRAFHKG
jgi:hypothetical protein